MTRAPVTASPEVVSFPTADAGAPVRAAYEHPWIIRATHWLTAVSLFVLTGSGLQIFTAFPSFGPKSRRKTCSTSPRRCVSADGWRAHSCGT